MDLGKNDKSRDRNDPHRRRLSPDEFAARDRRIWRMRADGYTVQEIADIEGCGLATVDRARKRLEARRERERELEAGDEMDCAARDDGGLDFEDARTPEDIARLDDLQIYRLTHSRGYLPDDHPAVLALDKAHAAGFRWPPVSEPVTYPVGEGVEGSVVGHVRRAATRFPTTDQFTRP